jgi:glycosyltransferase involved in cell wall biosynthesis
MKVSIIMACRNAEAYVDDAVRSVLEQHEVDLELLVLDGASTDRTVEVVERAVHGAPQGIDCRVWSEVDEGLYDALNRGVARSTGEVVGFVHADDRLASPLTLKRAMDQMARDGAQGVYGDLDYVRRDDPSQIVRHWRSGAFDVSQLRWGWMPPHPTLYLRRKVYESFQLGQGAYFDTALRCSADYEFMLRVMSRPSMRLAYLPEVMVCMRTGGISNRGIPELWRKSLEDWRAMRRHRVGGLTTLFAKNVRKLPQFR